VASVTGREEHTRRRICVRCGSSALAEVVMFREEDVRPLYEAAHNAEGSDLTDVWDAADRFPAPEDWKAS
jgi:hypothetical protein